MNLATLDHQLTFWLYNESLSSGAQQFWFALASYCVYALPIVLLYLFFQTYRDRLNAAKIFLVAVVSWQGISYFLGQFLYGNYGFRDRPFLERGFQELLFERPQKAFPSDHAAVLMGVTLAFFAYKYPKLGWLLLALALVSSVGRVVVGFHWAGDIVGGWLVGLVGFGLIRLLDGPITAVLDRIFTALRLKKKADSINYHGSQG